MISIIIPTLNEQLYLEKILENLSSQSFKDFEVIIVDGRSTDNTVEVADYFSNRLDIKVLQAGKRNISYQRNLGVKKSKYERLVFLDSDTHIEEGFLSSLFNSTKSYDIGVPLYRGISNKLKYRIFFYLLNQSFSLSMFFGKACGIGVCIVSTKKIHKLINGFNEELSWLEDLDYVFRASKLGRVKRIRAFVSCSIRRFREKGTKKTMILWISGFFMFLRGKIDIVQKIEESYFEKGYYKILLIQPKNDLKNHMIEFIENFTSIPLALLQLATLTPKEYSVKIVDENVEKLNYEKADLVGISIHGHVVADRAFKIAENFRKRGVTVIIGGIHAQYYPEECSEHADSVVIGEADEKWKDIIVDFRKGRLKKKYYCTKSNLRNLPPLDRSFIKDKKYDFKNLIQTTRGCPIGCDFCLPYSYYGKKARHKSIDTVLKEIRDIKNEKGKRLIDKLILFTDDNLMSDVRYSKRLFQALLSLNIRWAAQCSINIAKDKSLLELAYQSGCRALFIGFESIQQKNLTEINKSFDVNEYKKLIERIRKKNIFIYGSFVFGFFNEDKNAIRQTLDFCHEQKIDFANFHILTPYKGTKLYNKLGINERIIKEGDFSLQKNIILRTLHAYKEFYSLKYIFKRVIQSSHPFKRLIPLFFANMAFRRKIRKIDYESIRNLCQK